MGKYRVGIDIGGTFTDLVVFDEQTGELVIDKTFSTPPDFTVGVMSALQKIMESGYQAGDIHFLSHGTTVATNALLERKGANACLFITEGYRAVYEVGDQLREEDGVSVYNIFYEKPPPLIPQSRTIEVPERIDHEGKILRPLDESRLRQRVRDIKSAGFTSAAVCLLFSFMNPSMSNGCGRS